MGRSSTGPLRVQIQTQSGCNGRCVFCPNEGVTGAHLAQGRMDPDLFKRIVDQLAELQPRRISPYLMNEPLLDGRLPELVRYISEKVPAATSLVTTNGTHLTPQLAEGLIDAGLKRVKVSLQSLDPDTNKSIMGPQCDSARIIENVLACRRLMREKKAQELDLRVSMIVTRMNQDEIEGARKFWRRHDIKLVTSVLENRGGNIARAAELNPHQMQSFSRKCVRPMRELCILWNGDVVLCCVDWWRTVSLGNAARQSIRDIWESPRAQAIRDALREGDEDRLPKICLNCAESATPVHRLTALKRLLRGVLRSRGNEKRA